MNSNFEPNWFLHATAKELHLDGSIVHNAKSLIVTAALNDAQAKILRHYPPLNKQVPSGTNQKPCLVELSFGIALDGVLMAQGPPSLEKIQLTMNHTKTIIHGGLYDFIRDAKTVKRLAGKSTKPKVNLSTPINSNEVYQRLSPIIPKVIHTSIFYNFFPIF